MKKHILFIAFISLASFTNAQWVQQTCPVSGDLYSVYFTNANNGCAGGMGKIIQTTDGGTNWTAATIPVIPYNIYSIYFPTADTGYAVGDAGIILKTVNAGANWTIDTNTAHTSLPLNSVYFTNANTGYIVGGSLILKTINGGTNWTKLTSGLLNNSVLNSVYFTNADTGYAVGASATGDSSIIINTTNAGANWAMQINGLGSSSSLLSVYFPATDTGYAVGDATLKTTDGGNHWTIQSSIIDLWNSVYFPNTNTGYIVGNGGFIIKTSNGGISWDTSLVPGSLTLHSLFSVHFPTVDTGYVVGMMGTILKTTNGGVITSIEENQLSETAICIYPNPVTDNLQIQTTLPIKEIEITDITGRLLCTTTAKTINCGSFASGVYFIKATTEKGEVVKKFIKE
jgi:photosystem II stability/assembly factor-like uncharacterized protein